MKGASTCPRTSPNISNIFTIGSKIPLISGSRIGRMASMIVLKGLSTLLTFSMDFRKSARPVIIIVMGSAPATREPTSVPSSVEVATAAYLLTPLAPPACALRLSQNAGSPDFIFSKLSIASFFLYSATFLALSSSMRRPIR